MNIGYEDRCVGCLLGTACGDILGAAVEGWAASEIRNQYGQVRDFLDVGRGFGCYTDDTQMTLALATSLVERGAWTRPTSRPSTPSSTRRGGATAVRRTASCGSWPMAATIAARGGYSSPRAPSATAGRCGLRRWAWPIGTRASICLRQAVEDALLCTHVHPEAIDGALVQAKAVALAATTEPESLDSMDCVQSLSAVCQTDLMRAKLTTLADGLRHNDEDVFVIGRVGNGIRASQAVAAALWAFLRYGPSPEECIIRAVGFGGDTDTIGAMAGALVGALHGRAWIPARWYELIENGLHGRDEIVLLAKRLVELDIR